MTPDEIVSKWIGAELSSDDTATKDAAVAIVTGLRDDIQAAIEEEREACAKVAEELAPQVMHKQMKEATNAVSDAIRARSK